MEHVFDPTSEILIKMSSLDILNIQQYFSVSKGNEDRYLKLLGIFIKSYISDGDILLKKFHEKNWEELQSIAHKIKGSSGSLGLKHIFRISEDINIQTRNNNVENTIELEKNILKLNNKFDELKTIYLI